MVVRGEYEPKYLFFMLPVIHPSVLYISTYIEDGLMNSSKYGHELVAYGSQDSGASSQKELFHVKLASWTTIG
jgi:hypothetical protein